MGTYHQERPNTIKVELTEGCNLYCQMCGLRGIREKPGGPYLFMGLDMARVISRRISKAGWNSKIEFTMRGEPLLNPDTARIIRIFRKDLPNTHIMVTSNGIPLLRKPGVFKNLDRLFHCGLNILAMDCYEASKKTEAQVRQYRDVPVTDYPGGPSPYSKVKASVQRIILIEDFEKAAIEASRLGNKIVNNHCGAGAPQLEEPLAKRCARPFRELVFRFDGNVLLCCNSWRGLYKCGDVEDYESVDDLWNNAAFMAARRKLYHKDRDFGECAGCDNTSFRVGLLPDYRGQKKLRKPNLEDEKAIHRAMKGGPWTEPVLRPWESEEKED